jgi:hypothetical protein
MHFENIYKRIFYSYYAKNEDFNFLRKNYPKGKIWIYFNT